MKRLIDYHLNLWRNDPDRCPLLLHGARQVGKTHAARVLGSTFDNFVEFNLEELPGASSIFEPDLVPERIIAALTALAKKPIVPGKTLLFIDEIQIVPRAILALRYFYEKMPQLHVIGAGSLLDFALENIGSPVGRVQSMDMMPLSFIEFLAALEENTLIEAILKQGENEEIADAVHNKALRLVAEYMALGGMPQIVDCWRMTKNPLRCSKIHKRLIKSYRQDFVKYARKLQIKYVEIVFKNIPYQLGKKFQYHSIEGDYRKRELAPALDLLETAGIAHKVYYSSGHGAPIGAQIDPNDYRVNFLDVGLAQSLQSLDLAGWYLDPLAEFVNKGALVESFVGQELLAYSHPEIESGLYYWHEKSRSRQAEVDYLIQEKQHIVPVEVKGGTGKTLKSLHYFLETHLASPYGIRFSTHNFCFHEKIKSYPLYAVAKVAVQQMDVKNSIAALMQI